MAVAHIKVAYGTGIEESEETMFDVYPNPVKDVVNVTWNDIEEISLFNIGGQRIRSLKAEGRDNIQLNLSDLPNGVYILQAIGQGRMISRRIVKSE